MMRGALAHRLVAVEHRRLLQRDPLPKAGRDAVCAARMAGITPDEIEQVWAEALVALSDDELDQAYTASLTGRSTEALVRRTFEALARRTPEDHEAARIDVLAGPVPQCLILFRKYIIVSILRFCPTFMPIEYRWCSSRLWHNTTMSSRSDAGAWWGSANRAGELR